jgi:hypothetical protein
MMMAIAMMMIVKMAMMMIVKMAMMETMEVMTMTMVMVIPKVVKHVSQLNSLLFLKPVPVRPIPLPFQQMATVVTTCRIGQLPFPAER